MKGSTRRPVASSPKPKGVTRGRAIDFDRYIPTVVARLMTKLRISAQAFFDQKYGITRLDWRILSFLDSEGASSAYEIWTIGNLDKAAVSRAVKSLETRGLVTVNDVPKSARRRTAISLTPAGRKLTDQIFSEVIKRHRRLLGALTLDDIEKFIQTARYLEDRIPEMDQETARQSSTFDPTKLPPSASPPTKKSRK
ncbi:MarR family transcriptional regulator [Tardiphaga alba]|uniref:MarR family transcriptional regulator n=1 Tax=Tardiphaga alba TaxID=340268 RepID=A0ABX8ADX0_9BRAD|nr:MarR family transcriptional regulator [Tardiphaga alba]QUS41954.1 MarR family transcriptional regulator [Tardiphaga alba]